MRRYRRYSRRADGSWAATIERRVADRPRRLLC